MSHRKLTPREKAERKRRKREFMTIFVHGKQKRIRQPPTVDGMDADEFILRNADPIWLHQNEMWDLLEPDRTDQYCKVVIVARSPKTDIWLAHEGHLVQKSNGVLETNILAGDYTVEFGFGSPMYLLSATRDVRWTEQEITASPPCPRPEGSRCRAQRG